MVRYLSGLFLTLGVLMAYGCPTSKPVPRDGETPAEQQPPRDEFAGDRAPPRVQEVSFDAKRALVYLDDLCKLGPRVSGSAGMRKQQELLKKHFEDHGAVLRWQQFKAKQRSQRDEVEMSNLIVTWHPDRKRRVILCCHYDTRPIADQEQDPRNWRKPFLSANDGGSGVAFLMELAHHMKDLKTEVGVDFVIFDGEEYVFESRGDKYFFGSEHFGQEYRKSRKEPRYAAAILLDMIAGKDAKFPAEWHSLRQAGALVQDIWKIAAEQNCPAFQDRVGDAVLDDHLALNAAGIPAIDIIDFDYPHWHKLSDTPENCSADSFAQVARVITVWLQRMK